MATDRISDASLHQLNEIRHRVRTLSTLTENRKCADCGVDKPQYASTKIGVFICNRCAEVHKTLGKEHRVTHVTHGIWTEEELLLMETIGNKRAKEIYEKNVPIYYRKPKIKDIQIVLGQWIQAKYERKEFVGSLNGEYTKGDMECFLMKRGKKDNQFYLRKFVVEYNAGIIKYFVKQNHKKPKASINVTEVNLSFSPQKVHPNGVVLTYPKEVGTRCIYLYSEDSKTIYDWYTAVRAAKFSHMQIKYPRMTPAAIAGRQLTSDFKLEGYLEKAGPRVSDAYRKRYFILDERTLMYFENQFDAYAKGEIRLGGSEPISVKKGIDPSLPSHEFGFTLVTPNRRWLFGAFSDEECDAWVAALRSVIKDTASRDMIAARLSTSSKTSIRSDEQPPTPPPKSRSVSKSSESLRINKHRKKKTGLLERFNTVS